MSTMEIPAGLTGAGKRFWNFLFGTQKADGNEENSLARSDLITLYKQNLLSEKNFDSRMMENDHGFIQWFFPLPTVGVNESAPILSKKDFELIGAVPEAREKLLEHFHLFIDFLGIRSPDDKNFVKQDADRWNGWINSPHNNMRISRVLESMANFGLGDASKDFYAFLGAESQRTHSEDNFLPFLPATKNSCERFWVKSQNPTNWSNGR